jgi:Inner membrane protein YgaP-like, transmembrane domain
MTINMGNLDRFLRVVLGITMFTLGWIFHSWWGLIGIIPIATGTIGYCGLYALFGKSTCKVNAQSQATGECR